MQPCSHALKLVQVDGMQKQILCPFSFQNFIFLTVTHYGPLTTSIITTTRKFFTILASVLLFGNTLLTRQWVGVVMVFVGLGIDAYFGKAAR